MNKTFQWLKRLPSFEADELIHTQHEIVFQSINCLACANCCKTTPALLTHNDVTRIAKHLKLSNSTFIDKYTLIDEDGDRIINQTPCPFLQQDNSCRIYEVRPFACKDYPHTLRRQQQQLLKITEKNTAVCPAVAQIMENLNPFIE